jgi:hypothetical protein
MSPSPSSQGNKSYKNSELNTAKQITETGDPTRPFALDGNTFADFPSALQRSCGNQLNGCQAIVNGGNNTAGMTLADCDTQQSMYRFFCFASSVLGIL